MKKYQKKTILLICVCALLVFPMRASAQDDELVELIQKYEKYQANFAAIENLRDVEPNNYEVIEGQSFPVVLESFGETEVNVVLIMEKEYHRLAVLIANDEGDVLYKTNQLETNNRYQGRLEQPTKDIAAVSFRDLNGDDLKDIVLITNCENDEGEYADKTYKVGDVLFQQEQSFYRDWRISDKINRFSMNKSISVIVSYVRDGNSTEALYTATTLDELLDNGFQIYEQQCYYRTFERQGLLRIVPGRIRMDRYNIFMIYLMNEQGYIVWSFQPMGDYDNLYALKGMRCDDLDGDGMKDILVLGRYSYAGPDGKMVVDTRCSIYYQRTDGFAVDSEFADTYQCTEDDTVGGLVELVREYWGWTKEE